MALEIVEDDENTDRSALKSADEVFGYCASLALAVDPKLMPLIKEAQRRIRRRTNPEMLDVNGRYH